MARPEQSPEEEGGAGGGEGGEDRQLQPWSDASWREHVQRAQWVEHQWTAVSVETGLWIGNGEERSGRGGSKPNRARTSYAADCVPGDNKETLSGSFDQ